MAEPGTESSGANYLCSEAFVLRAHHAGFGKHVRRKRGLHLEDGDGCGVRSTQSNVRWCRVVCGDTLIRYPQDALRATSCDDNVPIVCAKEVCRSSYSERWWKGRGPGLAPPDGLRRFTDTPHADGHMVKGAHAE